MGAHSRADRAYMDFRSEEKNGVSTLVPFMYATKLPPSRRDRPHGRHEADRRLLCGDDEPAWVVAGIGKQLEDERRRRP